MKNVVREFVSGEMADIVYHLNHEDEQCWTVDHSEAGLVTLLTSRGEELYVRPVRNKPERLRVVGNYPSHNGQTCVPHGTRLPEITVARCRGARIIAREIVTRFLPAYREVCIQAQARVDARDTAEARRDAIMDRLAELACVREQVEKAPFWRGHQGPERKGKAYVEIERQDETKVTGHLEVTHTHRVALTLSDLEPEEARALLVALLIYQP